MTRPAIHPRFSSTRQREASNEHRKRLCSWRAAGEHRPADELFARGNLVEQGGELPFAVPVAIALRRAIATVVAKPAEKAGQFLLEHPKFDKIGSDLARFLGPTRVRSMG